MSQALTKGEAGMRPFTVLRQDDATGVSGTGVVVEGVLFACGQCVVHWLTPAPLGSIVIWPSFASFYEVHIAPHPGNGTVVQFQDGSRIEDGLYLGPLTPDIPGLPLPLAA